MTSVILHSQVCVQCSILPLGNTSPLGSTYVFYGFRHSTFSPSATNRTVQQCSARAGYTRYISSGPHFYRPRNGSFSTVTYFYKSKSYFFPSGSQVNKRPGSFFFKLIAIAIARPFCRLYLFSIDADTGHWENEHVEFGTTPRMTPYKLAEVTDNTELIILMIFIQQQ